MALRRLPLQSQVFRRSCQTPKIPLISSLRHDFTTSSSRTISQTGPNFATSEQAVNTTQEIPENDPNYSSFSNTALSSDEIASFDPIARASARKTQLPASRYGFFLF
jgi:hypothetical protein